MIAARATAARLRGGFVGGTSAAVAVGAHGAGGAMVPGLAVGSFLPLLAISLAAFLVIDAVVGAVKKRRARFSMTG